MPRASRGRSAARRGTRGTRLRVDVGARAFAHPGPAPDTLSGRRRGPQALLRGYGPVRRTQRGGSGDWNRFLPLFNKAQRKVEKRHRKNRIDLMVHEKQRQEILKDLGADPYVD